MIRVFFALVYLLTGWDDREYGETVPYFYDTEPLT